MEDIARSLRRAEIEAADDALLKNPRLRGRNSITPQKSSMAGTLLKAALVLAGIGALATTLVVVFGGGDEWAGPLRDKLARIPLVDKFMVVEGDIAREGRTRAASSPANSHLHLHHRLGGHHDHNHDHDHTRCEMNAGGDCVMVASPESTRLSEEEVQALMEDAAEPNDNSTATHSEKLKNEASASSSSKVDAADASSPPPLSPLDLRRAAALGDEDVVARCLASHPEWVDDADRNQWTPLHLSVRAGHLPVVRLLLQFGANVRAQTVTNESPLDMAQKRLGSDHPVTQLLQSHAVWLLSQSMHQKRQPQHS